MSARAARRAAALSLTLTGVLSWVQAWGGGQPAAWDVPRAGTAPVVDGVAADPAWSDVAWRDMKHLMWGSEPAPDDFSGRYKLVWTPQALYLLAEITDDVLIDTNADPLARYWEDDALEFFLDEDASGGIHLHDYNAFAQHVSLDNQSADMGPFASEEDEAAGRAYVRTYPEMVTSAWRRAAQAPHPLTWELKITVFGDDFHDDPDRPQAKPVALAAGKVMGFMLAYCDADSPAGREHFMGDVAVEPVDGDRNRGYIDADVFGRITLVE